MKNNTKIILCILFVIANAFMAVLWWPMEQAYAWGHLGLAAVFGYLAVKLAWGWSRMDY